MADRIVYAICEDNCKFETMSKEDILAAIEQAIETGHVSDPDGAVFSKIREIRASETVQIWKGTEAQFNAISPAPAAGNAIVRVGNDGVLYLCTDDSIMKDIEEHVANRENPHEVTAEQIGAAQSEHTHHLSSGSIVGITPVEKGGTGADNAEAARAALGITANGIGAVKKTGDTMTGALTVPDFNIKRNDSYNVLKVYLGDKTTGFLQQDKSSNRFKFIQVATDTAFSESFQLPRPAYALPEAKTYEFLTSKSPVTVAQGGTGANNKWDALLNLGLVVNNGRALFTNTKTKKVVFDIPFSEMPSVVLTAEGDTGSLYISDVSETGFTINVSGPGGTSNYNGYVNWLAISHERMTAGV